MNYETDIVNILLEAGSNGLSPRKIAHHVYNLHNGLFETADYDTVYKAVAAFVNKNRKGRYALLEPAGKYGFYRLSHCQQAARQQMFDFDAADCYGEEQEKTSGSSGVDLSLSLFD